jgi:NAD(P)H-hydrate epimerase
MELIKTIPPLPPRSLSGHKGLFGRVLVVGGHDQMIGAPVLAGTAALRMGAGLVQVATPSSVLPFALSITPELIGLGLGRGVEKKLTEAADHADAIILGPGLGQSDNARARVMRLIRLDKPMVIDADALNILSEQTRPRGAGSAAKLWGWFGAHAVLTPHPGEMSRLNKLLGRGKTPADDEGRIENAAAAAKTFGQVIVLKGDRTIVTDGKRVYINHSGNSTLSKAGTGDILSGILGALLGQKMDRFEAACAAVHLHGRAGEIAGERFGLRSALAREVIDAIPAAIALSQKPTRRQNARHRGPEGKNRK